MRIVLLLAAAAPFCAGQDWKTTVPFTYNIEYGPDHVGSEKYLKLIQDAPPDFLHVGEDLPFSSTFGTKADYAGVTASLFKLLTPEEVRGRMADLRRYTASLHQAGVRWVIPYICNELAFGDHVQRTGFFQFADHWDRYREFGYPPKPSEDIVRAAKFQPFPGLGRSKPTDGFHPFKVYRMCTNHPSWRAHLLAAAANAARCGYDGIFVDVMTLRDYCAHCQRGFREYLASRYPPERRRRRFGESDLKRIPLGVHGDGARWTDTQSFWSEANTDLLRAVAAEGRKINPAFFAVPNLGPLAHFDGIQKRVWSGMNPLAWARASDLFLVEEMQRPGHVMGGYFIHNLFQYKLAFAGRFRAGMLLYNAQDATGVELAMAEAGAGGGGALIQGHYAVPEVRRKYRKFFAAHRDLWEGYDTLADIAVVFDYEQLYWMNRANLQAVYRLVDYLSERHLLFDLITPAHFSATRLARYRAVITPSLTFLSSPGLTALRQYARSGGTWLDIGGSGRFDEDGHLRSGSPGTTLSFADLNELTPYPRFALYYLREDDANEITEIAATLKATLAGENPTPPDRVTQDLAKLLDERSGRPLAVLARQDLPGVRVSAYRKPGTNGDRIIAHLVNYQCQVPLQGKFAGKGRYESGSTPEELAPKPVSHLVLRLPVPPGKTVSARLVNADESAPQPAEAERKGAFVEIAVPALRIYQIVEATVR